MKIVSILGTRPEIIRLSRIIPKLDQFCEHIVVHTGQNQQACLSDIFFSELEIRQPNYFLDSAGTVGEQIAVMFPKIEKIFEDEKPDKVLILGDTNSALCSFIAERKQIPVYHLEAGNRCFDKRVPEEINRRIIDSISSFNLPYTYLSKENLLREGVSKNKIFVVGNPINEVIKYYRKDIDKSNILQRLKIKPRNYFLSTFHRSENVDDVMTLKQIVGGLSLVGQTYQLPVICGIHPRTLDKIKKWTVHADDPNVRFCDPVGFFDFNMLIKNALCVISDSGTVAEETCILRIPNVIIRQSTERPETIECGSSILAGVNCSNISKCVKIMVGKDSNWKIPDEYLYENVSDRVTRILLGEFKNV
jgi:UDP-N-acetylglucosamine 2-epimerase (non-hydrolysing)